MFVHVPVYALSRALAFPPPEHAVEGLVAVGATCRQRRLLLAYRSGIFPWYSEDLPILWHSPDPRCVMPIGKLHVGRTLRRASRGARTRCATTRRSRRSFAPARRCRAVDQDGTWITDDVEEAYMRLHAMGYAHSVEAWSDGELAGGLYGVSLGRMFFGESMFASQPNASKVALARSRRASRAGASRSSTRRCLRRTPSRWVPRSGRARRSSKCCVRRWPTQRGAGSWAEEEPPLDARP